MNETTPSPQPASLPRADGEPGTLEARILQVEQRLVAREENLRHTLHGLGLRLRRSLQPRRLVIPAVGVGVVAALLGLLWLTLARRRGALPGQGASAAPLARDLGGVGGWISTVGLVWPMLPAQWRDRIHATVTRLMLGIGLPWVEQLLAQREWRSGSPSRAPVPPPS